MTRHSCKGFLIALLLPCSFVTGQDDFGADIDRMFEQQSQKIDDIYDAVDKAISQAYEGLKSEIVVDWPDGALPDRTKWVTYNQKKTSRAIADYEQGVFIVETIVPETDVEDNSDQNEEMSAAFEELVELSKTIANATPTQLNEADVLLTSIEDELEKMDVDIDVTPSQLSAPQFETKSEIGQLISEETLALLSIDNAQAPSSPSIKMLSSSLEGTARKHQSNTEQATVTETVLHETTLASMTADASKAVLPNPAKNLNAQSTVSLIESEGKKKLRLTIPFINDFQKQLVKEHLSEIRTLAKQYDVPVSVVLAIIETESSFNPRAVSPIPAFGLMQLVPKTAGVDAHLMVYGEKKVVSPEFLFDEQNNLLLGSAYFHILTKRYLRKIEDPLSRFYCAVASYNTGVGNLAKTFIGKKNINLAVREINTMTSDQVYEYLLSHLPAQETRNYLKKVVTRKTKYEQFDA